MGGLGGSVSFEIFKNQNYLSFGLFFVLIFKKMLQIEGK